MSDVLDDIIRHTMRGTDFHALYPAKVVSQNSDDGTLELAADSDHIKLPSRVPLRLGLPGVAVKVQAGARVLVGFENGDEHAPVALLWEAAGLLELDLGVGATAGVVLDTLISQALTTLKQAISTAVIVPSDGGASFKSTLIASLSGWPGTLGSSKVKVVP